MTKIIIGVIITVGLFGQGLFAGTLSPRYLTVSALVYGITADSPDKLSTETRVLEIVKQYESSPALAQIIAKSILDPEAPEVIEWASDVATTDPAVISSIEQWAKRKVHKKTRAILDKEVEEFQILSGPFISMREIDIPFPAFFDDNYTTYVQAGLREELTQNDLDTIKDLVLEKFANFDYKVTATYNLLLKFYINQTDDAELLQELWTKYPFTRSTTLLMCAFANQPSHVQSLGLERVREIYTSCPAPEPGGPPVSGLEGLATFFLQAHLASDVRVNSLACEIVRTPLRFEFAKHRILYTLVKERAGDPLIEMTLRHVKEDIERTSGILSNGQIDWDSFRPGPPSR